MNRKFILLSERSQFEKAYCIISTIKNSGKGKSMESVKSGCQELEGGREMNRQSTEDF